MNRILLKYGIVEGRFPATFESNELRKNFFQSSIEFLDPLPKDRLIQLNIIINKLKAGLISIRRALSELGVSDIKQLQKEIEEDIQEGRNPFLGMDATKEENLGGMARNGETVEQIDRELESVLN